MQMLGRGGDRQLVTGLYAGVRFQADHDRVTRQRAIRERICTEGFDHATVNDVVSCSPSDPGYPRGITLQFSAPPESLNIVKARDVLRITPPLDNMAVSVGGDNELRITGRFAADQVYTVAIGPDGLKVTEKGRRNGPEMSWRSIISGEATLTSELNRSIDATGD